MQKKVLVSIIIVSLILLNIILLYKFSYLLRTREIVPIVAKNIYYLGGAVSISFNQTFLSNSRKIPNIQIKRENLEESTLYKCLNKKKTILLLYSERSCNACLDSLVSGCKRLYKNSNRYSQIFSVVSPNKLQTIKRFNKINNIRFPILWDYGKKLVEFLDIKTLPALLVIDKRDNIINSFFINPTVKKLNPVFFRSANIFLNNIKS